MGTYNSKNGETIMDTSEIVCAGILVVFMLWGTYLAAMSNHPLVGMDETDVD